MKSLGRQMLIDLGWKFDGVSDFEKEDEFGHFTTIEFRWNNVAIGSGNSCEEREFHCSELTLEEILAITQCIKERD